MDKLKDKLSASLEDYLEAIFELCKAGKIARSKDIAQRLCVSRASVTGALRSLCQKGLIDYKPYGYIELTENGKVVAGRIAGRHTVLESFFMDILGLDEALAKESACKAEHALGQQVVGRLMDYIAFVSQKKSPHNHCTEFQQFFSDRQRVR